jgi:hypothetical protein
MIKNIQKYNDFINESLLLEAKMVYNDDFNEILNAIDTPISQKIKRLDSKEVDVNTNYISVDTDKDDYILFKPDDKVRKLNPVTKSAYNSFHSLSIYASQHGYTVNNIAIPDSGQEVEELKVLDNEDLEKLIHSPYIPHNPFGRISHIRFTKNGDTHEVLYPTYDLVRNPKSITSNPYKIGRFVTNILTKAGIEFSQTEVEDFVSKFKAQVLKKRNILDNFHIVTGEDIRKYYSEDSYFDAYSGTLGSSCMRYNRCQPYFDIYVKNASLIIFKADADEDEIIGRALLWDAVQNSTGEKIKFMDRIYINNHSHTELFKEFAIKNGFFYKLLQDYSEVPFMFNDQVLSSENSLITIHLEKGVEYNKFPFIDTVCFYNVDDDTLTNDSSSSYDFELTTTNGRSAYCEYCEDGVVQCSECEGDGHNYCDGCDSDGYIDCDRCNGEGTINGESCSSCDGDGTVTCDRCDGDGNISCSSCDGDGTYTCPECEGE